MKSVVPRARHEKPQVAPAVASKKRKPAKPSLVESLKQVAAELDSDDEFTTDVVTIYEVYEPAKDRVLERTTSKAGAEGFSRGWNRNYGKTIIRERVAMLQPLPGDAFPQLPIGIYSPSGEFVKTVTMPDPRNGFCKHYNERSQNVAKPLRQTGGDA